jgi:hypothetical protein
MKKQAVAWWVAVAVAAIFLLGAGPVGNYASIGGAGTLSLLTSISLLFVGAVASIVALYWSTGK